MLVPYLVTCASVIPFTNGVVINPYGRTTTWHRSEFPIQIITDSTLSSNRLESLEWAVHEWNTTVGEQVFEISQERVNPYEHPNFHRHGTIFVTETDLKPDITLGLTNYYWDATGHFDHAKVTIDVLVTPLNAPYVFLHELGHSLGLTHDNFAESIMWPYAITSGHIIMSDDISFIRWEMYNDN